MTDAFGALEGETCWRDGCQGVIAERPVDNCSCHISPPCGACTKAREYCPSCDWQESDEIEKFNGYDCKINPTDRQGAWLSWKPRALDPRKIDYHIRQHTNSSQLCVGVYPPSATQDDVKKLVKGTFGGRFTKFSNGEFEYVAYTD